MNEIIDLLNKYSSSEYDIGDVSRILSYMSIPGVDPELLDDAANQIERIQFLVDEIKQYEMVKEILFKIIKNAD